MKKIPNLPSPIIEQERTHFHLNPETYELIDETLSLQIIISESLKPSVHETAKQTRICSTKNDS